MAVNSSLILIDVAKIVLNKCMEIADPAKQSVKFNYDYIDDFAEPETQSNPAGSYNITVTTYSIIIFMHITRLP